MFYGRCARLCLVAAEEPGFSPEGWLEEWGVPAGFVVAGVVLVWMVRNVETLSKPVRWLWRLVRPVETGATPTAADLADWAEHLRLRMGELWIFGDRAPLTAAERDSPSSMRHLFLEADTALLHPSRRSATAVASGDPIALDDDLGPGVLFELLDESMLIVGAPGAGKSVLLWQILRDRLATVSDASQTVPVLIELHRWPTIDTGEGSVPPFEDLLVTELAAPAVGVPPDRVRALITNNRLIYLLDGLDELPEEYGLRCLQALASFAQGPGDRALRHVALTCREQDYGRLVRRREVGTSAVVNALRITPFPQEVIQEAFERADPSPGLLPAATRRLPSLGRMLGTPLWLSIAEAVYQQDPSSDVLEELPSDADPSEIAARLYPQWLTHRLPPGSTPLGQLRFLAAAMRANRQETLYLETVQPTWLAWAGLSRPARTIASSVAGLFVGLTGLLNYGPVYGLADGLIVGLLLLLGGGLLSWWYFGEQEAPHVVADRSWLWREAVSSRSLIMLALGVCLGLGIWALPLEVPFGRQPGYGSSGLRIWAAFGLSAGLITGPLTSARTITPAVEGRSPRPMDVLRRSVGHGLAVGVAFGLALLPGFVALVWFFGVYGQGSFVFLSRLHTIGMMLSSLLLLTIAAGIHFGLGAGLGHMAARVATAYRELLPLRLVAFLDKASADGILYPAGPGYRFRHRTLGEFLAEGYRDGTS